MLALMSPQEVFDAACAGTLRVFGVQGLRFLAVSTLDSFFETPAYMGSYDQNLPKAKGAFSPSYPSAQTDQS